MIDTVNLLFVSSTNCGHDCIQVYDSLTGSQLHSYKGVQAAPSSLTITGPNKLVVCGCKDRALLQAWQIHRRDPVSVRLSIPSRVNALAVSPTQPTTLVAGIKESLHIYNIESGCRLAVINRHYQPVTSLAFTECGNFFFSAAEDGLVYMWRVQSVIEASNKGSNDIRPFKQLGQHSDKVSQISVSTNRIVTVSVDQSARVYCLQSLVLLHTLVLTQEITCSDITTEGSRIALGTSSGHTAVIDLFPSTQEQTIKITDEECSVTHKGAVASVQLLPSGCSVATAGKEDGEVKVWQVKDDSDRMLNILSSSEKEKAVTNTFKKLAWKRSFHKGKGTVTNMVTATLDRQVLSKGWGFEQEVHDLHTGSLTETSIALTADSCMKDAFEGAYCPSVNRYPENYEKNFCEKFLMNNL